MWCCARIKYDVIAGAVSEIIEAEEDGKKAIHILYLNSASEYEAPRVGSILEAAIRVS